MDFSELRHFKCSITVQVSCVFESLEWEGSFASLSPSWALLMLFTYDQIKLRYQLLPAVRRVCFVQPLIYPSESLHLMTVLEPVSGCQLS